MSKIRFIHPHIKNLFNSSSTNLLKNSSARGMEKATKLYDVTPLSQLIPTQITVGMRLVREKQAHLRALKKNPEELKRFLLDHPIRVVLGPGKKVYVIDHHHLALALIREGYKTALMKVEADYSNYDQDKFWKKMQKMKDFLPRGNGCLTIST